MAEGGISATIKQTKETKDAIERLRVIKATPEMRKAMMSATAPAVPALRRAIRAIPSNHESTQTPTLTESLAKKAGKRSIMTKSTVTVLVRIKGGGLANLARSVEGDIPWEHPTFGHDPVVDQKATPFFHKTMHEVQALVHERMKTAQIKIKKQL